VDEVASTSSPNVEILAEEPLIIHTLFEEEQEEVPLQPTSETERPATETIPFEGYIPTSEFIKNIQVESSLVDIHHLAEFEQLVINEINVNDFEVVKSETNIQEPITNAEILDVISPKPLEEMEFVIHNVTEELTPEVETEKDSMLMFDMPMHTAEEVTEVKRFDLQLETEEGVIRTNAEDIEVNDPLEVVPVSEVSKEGIKRYSLDDYKEKEEELIVAKPAAISEIAEEDLVFETKTIETKTTAVIDDSPRDPINTPISKLLRDRTEERKRKMKDFNYQFRNSASKIDDIEKQPAYKRAGIELEATTDEVNLSRTSVNTDDEELDLRTNNSFLHDNVD
jgi:cell division protein FtsZ